MEVVVNLHKKQRRGLPCKSVLRLDLKGGLGVIERKKIMKKNPSSNFIGLSNSGNSYKNRAKVLSLLRFSNYREYLASPLWASIRERVFKVKGRKCYLCGNNANQVHHNRYRLSKMSGKSLKFLVPLCGDCHKGIEFKDGDKVKKSNVVAINYKNSRQSFISKPIPLPPPSFLSDLLDMK
jgi:hypothetical protein